jgi:hypothetical protein
MLFCFKSPEDLENMITKVLKLGLEGLVLKDLMVSAEHLFTCGLLCLLRIQILPSDPCISQQVYVHGDCIQEFL